MAEEVSARETTYRSGGHPGEIPNQHATSPAGTRRYVVCLAGELEPGSVRPVRVGGRRIAVANLGRGVYKAFSDTVPLVPSCGGPSGAKACWAWRLALCSPWSEARRHTCSCACVSCLGAYGHRFSTSARMTSSSYCPFTTTACRTYQSQLKRCLSAYTHGTAGEAGAAGEAACPVVGVGRDGVGERWDASKAKEMLSLNGAAS